MKTEVLLGIDIGSTSIRCCVFDTDKKLLKEASRPTAQIENIHVNQGDSKRSWDVSLLWQLVTEVILETTSFVTHHNLFPLGIATSSVGCSPVIMDKQGNTLFQIIRHQSSKSYLLQKYKDQFGEYEFQRITGYPLAPTSTGFLLAQIKESAPEIYSKIDSIFPVSNYIAYKLTGEKTADRSIAGSFGLWDHQTNSWWTEFLSDLGLVPSNFGTIVDGGAYVGKITPKISEITGLRVDLPVYSGGHDYLCAALAADCFRPGQIFNIEGTFEIVATFHKSPIIKSSKDSTRSIMDIHVLPQVYSFMVERIGAGQIEWLKNLLFPSLENQEKQNNDWDSIFTEINEIIEDQLSMEVFIPYIFGMLFPEFNDGIRGGILGINQSSTRSSIMRSAIFSSCFESKRMIDYQRDFNSEKVNQITTVGGATRSKYWMQHKANVLGMKIVVPKIKEPSALGAALFAGIGSGVIEDLDNIGKLTHSEGVSIYEPEIPKSNLYIDYYQRVYLPVLEQVSVIEKIIGNTANGRK
ncbi:MAG: FGGY-family carbohydrate kinase [Anaerolineales bacterium]|nr:FGGY-family carbohydrate kinase [Anaerolineales bacterium]